MPDIASTTVRDRYPLPPLEPGRLLRRYKRFFADIELDTGETIVAHCPNTGPMTGVCLIGNRVMVSRSDNPKRKLAYTWELIEVADNAAEDNAPTWTGINTALPNRVMRWALDRHLIPELDPYGEVASEVCYGQEKSRVDFVLQQATGPLYLEIKNTTWADRRLVKFPDTVTTRGQKHLRELTALRPDTSAAILYFINRGDCTHFSPGDSADPLYGKLLRQAIAAGVQVLACRFAIAPGGVEYLGLAELVID
jgi:sugar fermentation stimulation protein A